METAPSAENVFIRHATVIAIATVTALTLLAGLVFWQQAEAGHRANDWVVHSYEVRGHIRLLFSGLRDAEIGQRDFIATGIDGYLDPYERAMRDVANTSPENTSSARRGSIAQEIAILRTMTADNPTQQINLDELEVVVKKLLDYLAATIEARRSKDPGAIAAVLDLRTDRELLDRARNSVRLMDAEETHLLTLRTESEDITSRQTQWMTLAAIGVFYAGIVLAIWLYQTSRARARLQMMRYTQELERSEEELKMQQEELKTSNEEIEASNEELEEKTRVLEEQNAQIQQQSEELTESKRLIEEKATELERASRYKSEFLANMSHELRTPLNSLLILARLLAANEDGNLTAEQVEEAHVIHNGGLELLGLINDILDLSKVEAGKLTVSTEDVAVENIVGRLQQQFAPIAKESGVAFPIKVAAGLPSVLHTDTQRVEQILKNLLSNAFKFTQHGSVTLEVRRPDQNAELQRASLDYSASIAFSVIDTGIGIEASKFKDIFEAFQQEDGSIDRHYGGTGLGLTIARKFAHILGGEIHVRSRKGEGSAFTLVLPVAMDQAWEPVFPMPAVSASAESVRTELKTMPRTSVTEFIADDRNLIGDKDKVLLIIEDDAGFAATLMKIGRRRGYKCLAAGDGKSGLVLAVEQPVTAVILDLKLPDIDGMRVLDHLKHDLRTRHIPVHIISGRDDAGTATPLRKGAIGSLAKPVQIEALDGVFNKIEDLLASKVKRVLVVEDDKKTQVAIEALLRKKDIQITIAGTGTEGFMHAKDAKFDCVILDLQLPDMTGFEWLERLERELGEAAPPVVVYTARDLSEDENRKLSRYTGSIVVKGAKSPERLLDEVTLFLHSVESSLSTDQQEIIRMQHNPDKVLQGRTLLLVDDDLRNTFALSKLLKKHGLNIVIADDGQMALDRLKEDKSIELIIMDIMMPIMDGYQAMHEIRAQNSFNQVPIIALTARAMPEEQEKCMAAGANDYLTKPVDIERLLTLLRVWLFRQEMAA
ncbi:MAG: protein DhkJ [Hyphomicrobiales bacterium]|nr:protein DhkJ [Hyphomicrobiales bacterium]